MNSSLYSNGLQASHGGIYNASCVWQTSNCSLQGENNMERQPAVPPQRGTTFGSMGWRRLPPSGEVCKLWNHNQHRVSCCRHIHEYVRCGETHPVVVCSLGLHLDMMTSNYCRWVMDSDEQFSQTIYTCDSLAATTDTQLIGIASILVSQFIHDNQFPIDWQVTRMTMLVLCMQTTQGSRIWP